MAIALADFFANETVASFGDGPGIYKVLIDKTGKVQTYDAFDGAPYAEEVTNGSVRFLDLSAPQYGLKAYDWILCLEVAEHIPREFESTFLDNLVRHARRGIVLSWAKLGQGGLAHVNNRPLEYVIDQMSKRGFALDKAATELLQNSCILNWLRNNVKVYMREDTSSFRKEDI